MSSNSPSDNPIAGVDFALASGDVDMVRMSLRRVREVDATDSGALVRLGAGTAAEVQEFREIAGDLGVPFDGDRRHGQTLREAVATGDLGVSEAARMDAYDQREWVASHETNLFRAMGIDEDELAS